MEPNTSQTASSHAPPDAHLINLSRAGSLEAWEMLYDRYHAVVFRHAYHVLGNADDADDVRQETFVRAFGSLSRFRGEATLKTYLLTICSNLCRDNLRKSLRRPESAYGLSAPDGLHSQTEAEQNCDPLHALQRAFEAEQVRGVLAQMPAQAREILMLRHVEELDFDEIALVLNCTTVAAPVRLFRARKQFQALFMKLINTDEEKPS
jgi:RNA polymerase sigma-70 factor (ECF subfamily)